jgi:hypothetical protein
MSSADEVPWSPARDPYAIAVSQSWWALRSVTLFATDAQKSDGHVQQIYARQLFGHLRVLRRCAEMMATALERQGIDEGDRDGLDREIQAFDEAAPSAKDARDILEHFDDYARGKGKLELKAMQDLGIDEFEAAAMFWGGGYDPSTDKLTQGPFEIVISDAIRAAERLHAAIFAAGRAIDRARAGPSRSYHLEADHVRNAPACPPWRWCSSSREAPVRQAAPR